MTASMITECAKKLKIAIVAGEASGDILGAVLLKALKKYYPQVEAVGIAGPKMLAEGAKTLVPMEKISVMGFSEVLLRARELLRIRAEIKNYFLQNPPDVYIGIDSPDFNLPIETALKKQGIKTVHCNSPTIWAWRKKRIVKIARAVDLMLVLFPFESQYYIQQKIPVEYIGHPLADAMPLNEDTEALQTAQLQARRELLLTPTLASLNTRVIALLPGSRQGEIKHIGPVILKAAQLLHKRYPDSIFIVPMANPLRLAQFQQQCKMLAPSLPLKLYLQQSALCLAAADEVIVASGTATLEALLAKKPMVVIYRGSRLSYWIARSLVKISQVSLPNILAGEALVPELIQDAATPEEIARHIQQYQNQSRCEEKRQLQQRFLAIHQALRCDAGERAALAILRLFNHVNG